MHILTGLVLAALAQRKRGRSALPLLRTGPVQTAHLISGRVRFRVPSLVGAAEQAEILRAQLVRLEGVTNVKADAGTGSVVIQYADDQVRPELLFAAVVRLLGLDGDLEQTPRPKLVREARSLVCSLDRVVYDRTAGLLDFSSALLILLTAFGVRKVMQQGAAAMPSGATMIWWGFHQLLGHGEE